MDDRNTTQHNEALDRERQIHGGDINFTKLAVIGLVSGLLILELVVGLQAVFYNIKKAEIQQKDISQPNWELEDMVLTQQTTLNSYRWVNRADNRVAIPIDEAITRFVQHERQAVQPPGQAVQPRGQGAEPALPASTQTAPAKGDTATHPSS